MKIPTSTSFVMASLAISSSALAMPLPDSPDLSGSGMSPRSARTQQGEQFAGRSPAIRSGSGSRRSLPRRSLNLDADEAGHVKTTDSLGNDLDNLLKGLGLDVDDEAEKDHNTKHGSKHSQRQIAAQVAGDLPSGVAGAVPVDTPVSGVLNSTTGSLPLPAGAPNPVVVAGGLTGTAAGMTQGVTGAIPISGVTGSVSGETGVVGGASNVLLEGQLNVPQKDEDDGDNDMPSSPSSTAATPSSSPEFTSTTYDYPSSESTSAPMMNRAALPLPVSPPVAVPGVPVAVPALPVPIPAGLPVPGAV
ncbi:hypothetical protein EW145_g1263, partial [Phellinidium pouzarii]